MKLRVLAGAKEGLEIPLKKPKFIIGRASDCSLRAGSEAISRHHCAVLRTDDGVHVRDLGSRNGTYVNDRKIGQETKLTTGDRLRIGPLEFVFEAAPDLARDKKPPVKDIAEAVDRSAKSSAQTVDEDDISDWLISGDSMPTSMTTHATSETQSFLTDETQAIRRDKPHADDRASAESNEEEAEAAGKSDAKVKGAPGKLPTRPAHHTKDSREAASEILRNLARRR